LLRRWIPLNDWRSWYKNFQMPPLEFYGLLEAAIRRRQIPDLEISHKNYRQSCLLSDRRVYLRLRRDRMLFDCCAAPFGTDYFFSYWLWFLPRRFTFYHFLGLATISLIGEFAAHHTVYWLDILMGFLTMAFILFLIVRSRWFPSSLWLEEYAHGLSVIGVIWELFFRRPTYFEQDTASVFHAVIHDCYMDVLDGLTQTHSLRALSEEERQKPVMRDFFDK